MAELEKLKTGNTQTFRQAGTVQSVTRVQQDGLGPVQRGTRVLKDGPETAREFRWTVLRLSRA